MDIKWLALCNIMDIKEVALRLQSTTI